MIMWGFFIIMIKFFFIFLTAWLSMAVMGINIQLLTPINSDLKEVLNISYSMLGILMGIISLPGIFISSPIGQLADKIGRKYILATGFFLICIGNALFPIFSNFNSALIGRILIGIGCSIISVLVPGIIPQYLPKENVPQLMGIFNTAIPVGSILTLTFYHNIAQKTGLFESFYIPIIISVFLAILFLFFPEKNIQTKDIKEKSKNIWIPNEKIIIPLSIIVLVANLASMAYVTLAPSYFEQLKISWNIRGTMLSAGLWGSIFFAPLVGKILSKGNYAKIIIITGLLSQGIGLILIPFVKIPLIISLILFCFGAGIIMTPIYVIIPKYLPQENINTAFGFIISSMMIGCLFGPYVAGKIMDMSNFAISFAVCGIISIFGIFACFAIKASEKTT